MEKTSLIATVTNKCIMVVSIQGNLAGSTDKQHDKFEKSIEEIVGDRLIATGPLIIIII